MRVGKTGRWGAVAIACAAALCIPTAYFAVFTGFAEYDDTGMFLLSIKLVSSGRDLYDQVVAGYGPLYYVVFVPLSKVLGGIDHDSGRLIVLTLWVAASALSGIVIRWLTASAALGVVGVAAMFWTLAALTPEPMNPGGLLALCVILMVAASAARSDGYALGALGAGAALVKLNVGAFALLPAGFALIASRSTSRRSIWAAGVLAFGGIPALVAVRDLGSGSARAMVALVLLAGVGIVVSVNRTAAGADGPSPRSVLAGAAAITAFVALVTCLALGSSPRGLFQGTVTDALRISAAFKRPAHFALAPAAVGLLLAFVSARVRMRDEREAAFAGGVARFLVGVYLFSLILMSSSFAGPSFTPSAWGAGLAWVATLRDPRVGTDQRFARGFIASLAVLQAMYAYPVAGTQASYAAVPLVFVAAICTADGARLLAPELARHRRVGARGLRAAAALGALACLCLAVAAPLSGRWRDYHDQVSLRFAGAGRVHVPVGVRRRLEWLDRELRPCSTFITEPGMSSLYLFAGKDPPEFLPQVWMRVLTAERQSAIVRRIKADPAVCAVRNSRLARYWSPRRTYAAAPLVQFIDSGFRLVASAGDDKVLRRTRRDVSHGVPF